MEEGGATRRVLFMYASIVLNSEQYFFTSQTFGTTALD